MGLWQFKPHGPTSTSVTVVYGLTIYSSIICVLISYYRSYRSYLRCKSTVGKIEKGEQSRRNCYCMVDSESRLKSLISVLRFEKVGITFLEIKNKVPTLTLLNIVLLSIYL